MRNRKTVRILSLSLTLVFMLALLSLLPGCSSMKTVTLNVYNWGEYISDGSEGCLDVNKEFENYWNENFAEEYGYRVKVNYTMYASNEDMYAKLKSEATRYDVIIPSDYMIARLIDENMLAKINFDLVPNYEDVAPEFKNQYFDPTNEYCVPYTCGMVGIIYNTEMVDEEDIGGWSLMFDKELMEKYKGSILQFNNSRDAFGSAQYYRGIDVNTTNETEWREALDCLKAQKPYIQSYVMDEVFNKMKGESAAIAPYYVGDFLSMYEDNENLAFYYPEEGTNIFIDAMCIPANSRHQDVAAIYINFMASTEIAMENAEYIYYATPMMSVRDDPDYQADMMEIHEDAMKLLYPETSVFTSYYYTLDPDTLNLVNDLWEELKIESTQGATIYYIAGGIVLICAAIFIALFVRKKRRERYY